MRSLFQKFFALLKPWSTQQNHGLGSVQAAKLNGNVHVHNNRTTHVHLAVHPPDATWRTNKMAKKQSAYAPREARPDQANAVSKYKGLTQAKRREAARFMLRQFKTSTILELDTGQIVRLLEYISVVEEYEKLPSTQRNGVHGFMLREFETNAICELDHGQVFRLKKYIEACVAGLSGVKAVRRKTNDS